MAERVKMCVGEGLASGSSSRGAACPCVRTGAKVEANEMYRDSRPMLMTASRSCVHALGQCDLPPPSGIPARLHSG